MIPQNRARCLSLGCGGRVVGNLLRRTRATVPRTSLGSGGDTNNAQMKYHEPSDELSLSPFAFGLLQPDVVDLSLGGRRAVVAYSCGGVTWDRSVALRCSGSHMWRVGKVHQVEDKPGVRVRAGRTYTIAKSSHCSQTWMNRSSDSKHWLPGTIRQHWNSGHCMIKRLIMADADEVEPRRRNHCG